MAYDSESDDMFVMLDGEGRIFGCGDGMDYSFRVEDDFPTPPPSTNSAADEQTTIDDLIRECLTCDMMTECTLWLGAEDMEAPNCALEQLAAAIFKHHTKSCDDFDPESSGVEWWIQSRDPGTNQGLTLHWDKDEDLRIHHGLYAHPQLSTVTYLTEGAPTVIFDGLTVPAIARHGNGTPAGLSPSPECTGVYVSYPKPGKHIAFDGRLLHGVLNDLSPESSKDARRVTFLANVWLNHTPKGVTRLPLDAATGFGLMKPTTSLAAKAAPKPREVTKKIAPIGGNDLFDFGCFGWNGDDFKLSSKLPKSSLSDSGSGTLLVECSGIQVVENEQQGGEQKGAKRQRVE